jgi:hypothetical protein
VPPAVAANRRNDQGNNPSEEIAMTLPPIGDPTAMRPATRRRGFDYSDPIGEYELRNGRTVQLIWLTVDQTRSNVVAWEVNRSTPAPVRVVENVYRIHASRVSEQLLDEFETLATS